MIEPLQHSALELAALVRTRKVSAEELTSFYLDRIARLDERLSSFVTVLRHRARLYARYQDHLVRAKGADELGSFHGVPTALKDLTPMRGTFTRLGSRSYRWFVSPVDTPTTTYVKRAGFVILGKTATSEFGVLPVTEPLIHPPTRNPWSTAHTPGGSSGGAAAAVAAGFVPIAQGSDGGGSVRIPAAFCHLFGFKPSLSLLGNMHGAINKLGMSVIGPIALTVEDAAAMLDVWRGDTHSARLPASNSCLAWCRETPRPLRIRVCLESAIGPVEPAIAAAVSQVARTLADLGHHVGPSPRPEGTVEEFLPLWQVMLAAVPVPFESLVQPVTRWLRELGRTRDLDEVKRAQRAIADRIAGMFGDADIVLSPTVPVFPPRIGALDGMEPRAMFEAIGPIGAFTAAFNISLRPAASVPAGVAANGLPFAIQLGGNVGKDGEVLALARQLEQALPWRQRRSPFMTQ